MRISNETTDATGGSAPLPTADTSTNGVTQTKPTNGADGDGNSTTQFNGSPTPTGTQGTTQTTLTNGDTGSPNAGYACSPPPPSPPPPPDPKMLLKDDETYQQLASDLNQLQGIDFDDLEASFPGFLQSPDGKLSEGDCRWATDHGTKKQEADAVSLTGNPRLWKEMDQDGDKLVSKDEFLAKIRSLKATMASMEKEAVKQATTPPPSPGSTPPVPPPATPGSSPTGGPPMDAATAAGILLANFELVDSPTGDGKDGVSRWEEVMYVHDHTSDPNLKAAIEFFKDHRDEWHLMENLNADKGSLNDDVFSKDELTQYYQMKKAGASAGNCGSPSTNSGDTSTDSSGSSGTTSTTGSSRSAASALENASTRIGDARDNVEKRISDLSDQLASLDPEKDKAKIAQLERQIQALTNTQTMLAQLENQLFQMIQNMIKMRHDVAMNAIRHIN